MVSPDHQPLLMDFGISHLLTSTSTYETATRSEKGSARWMAIELLLGTAESSPEDDVHTMMSDVWAFGMTVLVSPFYVLKNSISHSRLNRNS